MLSYCILHSDLPDISFYFIWVCQCKLPCKPTITNGLFACYPSQTYMPSTSNLSYRRAFCSAVDTSTSQSTLPSNSSNQQLPASPALRRTYTVVCLHAQLGMRRFKYTRPCNLHFHFPLAARRSAYGENNKEPLTVGVHASVFSLLL